VPKIATERRRMVGAVRVIEWWRHVGPMRRCFRPVWGRVQPEQNLLSHTSANRDDEFEHREALPAYLSLLRLVAESAEFLDEDCRSGH
jgi:hypothetical protein